MTNTVTAAPAISRPITENSMVPAAPVSGSWVMFLTLVTWKVPLLSLDRFQASLPAKVAAASAVAPVVIVNLPTKVPF